MSAHFDGGEEIAGRRLREVEVTYVDDPTLDMGAEDSDDCPASPPPTYYLRVREERKKRPEGGLGSVAATDESGGSGGLEVCDGDGQNNGEGEDSSKRRGPSGDDENTNNDANGGEDRSSRRGPNSKKRTNSGKGWSWRYVNVENKALLVWDRRGGRLLRSIPLRDVESLLVLPDQDAPASILEVYISSAEHAKGSNDQNGNDGVGDKGIHETEEEEGRKRQQKQQRQRQQAAGDVLVLQARSRRETLLWAKVLQENVELMTKRRIPLENRDKETSLSDVQQLAKLLTHQLSELQNTGDDNNRYTRNSQQHQKQQQKQHQQQRGPCFDLTAANATIPEEIEREDSTGATKS